MLVRGVAAQHTAFVGISRGLELDSMRLSAGSHSESSGEMCVMEAAAALAGEGWTDRPASVSPVITALLTSLNDAMDGAGREELKQLLPILPGSRRNDAVESTRMWMVLDWHSRTWTSVWLRSIGCADEADALSAARALTDTRSLRGASRTLGRARANASAMRMAMAHEALEQSFDAAVAASDGDPTEPAIVAARAALQNDAGGLAIRAAQKDVPGAAGWHADRSVRWVVALDAAGYRLAVAAGTAQVAAIRAAAATSAWNMDWNVSDPSLGEEWRAVRDQARSIGRDVALMLAWQPALKSAMHADQRSAWPAAAGAAAAALRAPLSELHRSVVALVRALVEAGSA